MLQAARKQVVVAAPNDLWTVDFKGWWTTRDGRRCEPLNVRDAFSRYILALRILPRSATEGVRGRPGQRSWNINGSSEEENVLFRELPELRRTLRRRQRPGRADQVLREFSRRAFRAFGNRLPA
jgi:transposase InsO family protein